MPSEIDTRLSVYRELSEREPSIPVYLKGWWLDASAPAAWSVCMVERGDEVVAAMPYVCTTRRGFTFVGQSPLTPWAGPWIRAGVGKGSTLLARERELMNELIDQLPRFDHFAQHWHYSRSNWIPFYWRGFSQTTRYTYVIDDLTDIDQVYADFVPAYRNKIRKADRSVQVRVGGGIEELYRLNVATFKRQSLPVPFSYQLLVAQDHALINHRSREVFYAVDGNGDVHSALYLVWDSMSSYVHLVGEDPGLRNSGAGIRLIWEAIKYTRDVLRLPRLDFEGSMLEGVECVRRDCGARQMAYHAVTKTPSRVLRMRSAVLSVLR